MQLKSVTILEHLIAAFIAILKQVPGVGAIIDYRDRIEAIQQARQIDSIEQRITAIKPNQKAIAFNKAQQANTEAELEKFIRDYPKAAQVSIINKLLEQLRMERKQREQPSIWRVLGGAIFILLQMILFSLFVMFFGAIVGAIFGVIVGAIVWIVAAIVGESVEAVIFEAIIVVSAQYGAFFGPLVGLILLSM